MIRFFTIFSLLLALAACNQGETQAPGEPGSEAASAKPAEPRYVSQEDQFYGYKRKSGDVLMLAYLGERNGVMQVMEQGDRETTTVYECADPCRSIKTYKVAVQNPPEVLETTQTDAVPDTVPLIAMQDAGAGLLEPFIRRGPAGPQRLWVGEDGPVILPEDEF